MKLYRYKDFTNEGIISKGLELLNYRTIKENDKIAKKYIEMIYKDWEKNKNLMAVFLNFNDSNTSLTYKISDDPYTQCNTKGGDFEKETSEIKLMSINESGWDSDITRARIEATKFVQYKGDLHLFGRDMETNEVIVDNNGIEGDVYAYLNISKDQVDRLINFFKGKFIEKYPQLRGNKHFSYIEILKHDKDLKDFLIKRSEDKRKSHIEQRKLEEEKYTNLIKEHAKFDEQDIKDLFVDLTDFINERIYCKLNITIGYVDDVFISDEDDISHNSIYNLGVIHGSTKHISKSTNTNNIKNKIIYTLKYVMNIDLNRGLGHDDENNIDTSGLNKLKSEIISFFNNEYKNINFDIISNGVKEFDFYDVYEVVLGQRD